MLPKKKWNDISEQTRGRNGKLRSLEMCLTISVLAPINVNLLCDVPTFQMILIETYLPICCSVFFGMDNRSGEHSSIEEEEAGRRGAISKNW